ncbi:thioredoxin-like domain-containing protein [Opitutus sp. ER46]|uniref:thioredoxin-like domain-containing protein n=1 Tax=Opitutus sp. ER46 TaxID=2161864 RepID=UPI000D30DF9C|nr:thioredoxin-like domain-containing protein [Opitutus sp. ER46]PTX94188.1 hypothetical protein DB354_10495 [Opitutus sp. ER46]
MKHIALLLLLAVSAGAATTETWQTRTDGTVKGQLAGIYGRVALFADAKDNLLIPLDELAEAEVPRVATYIAAHPPQTVSWADSQSRVAATLKGKLAVLAGERLVDFEPGNRVEPEFYLIYFGAHWCGPCRQFSPDFVRQYHALKQSIPDLFEVIFVSSDETDKDQLTYMREAKMPWPAVKFRRLESVAAIERWAGPGIPCVVLLNRDGEMLFHSYKGETYVGPQKVLDSFVILARSMANAAENQRSMHRFAVYNHVQGAAGGNASPKPYAMGLNLDEYQTLEASTLTATLQVDAAGRVTDASFAPPQGAVINQKLVDDTSRWLFLPRVKNGVAVATRLQVPLAIHR